MELLRINTAKPAPHRGRDAFPGGPTESDSKQYNIITIQCAVQDATNPGCDEGTDV